MDHGKVIPWGLVVSGLWCAYIEKFGVVELFEEEVMCFWEIVGIDLRSSWVFCV